MSLAEELRKITEQALQLGKVSSEAYLAWRKKYLTIDFFEKLKQTAQTGKGHISLNCEESETQYLQKWALDHGFGNEGRKIWWTVQ